MLVLKVIVVEKLYYSLKLINRNNKEKNLSILLIIY